jgi:hypothetical protein
MGRRNFERFRRRRPRTSRRYEWKSCSSKTAFKEFEAKHKAREFGQRAYACDLCGKWHLTSMKQYNFKETVPDESAE